MLSHLNEYENTELSMCLLFPVLVCTGNCGHHQFPGDNVTDVSELQGKTHIHTQ